MESRRVPKSQAGEGQRQGDPRPTVVDVPGIGSKAVTWFAGRAAIYSPGRDLGKRETSSWILLAAKNNGPIRSPWAKSMRYRNRPSFALPLST